MEEAAKTSDSRFYRPELDVVRFLAFSLVFLFHLIPEFFFPGFFETGDPVMPAHFAGVVFRPALLGPAVHACRSGLNLFFTLSAFLICELLLREREVAGTVGVKRFYVRRLLRIWPLYYFCLLLFGLYTFLPGGHTSDLTRIGWFSVFMGAWFTSIHGMTNNPVMPLWSISVEEQFYLFAPWVVKYFNRKTLFGFCALLVVVSNVTLYHLGKVAKTDFRVWTNSLIQFECFAAGILLCLLLRGRMPKLALWQRAAILLAAFFCWSLEYYSFHAMIDLGQNPGSWMLIAGYGLGALGSAMVLLSFLGIKASLMPGWAVYLGRISYGLYVYHYLAIIIARHLRIGPRLISIVSYHPLRPFLSVGALLSVSFGLTLLMASASYRYFEMPFLRMKKRFSVIQDHPPARDL